MTGRKGPDASAPGAPGGKSASSSGTASDGAGDAETLTANVSLVQAVEDPSLATEVIARTPTNPGATPAPLERRTPLADPARRRGVGLRAKFNAALLFAFGVGFLLTALLADRVVKDNAREEVLQEARIMLESALSARAYTAEHIKPLLEEQLRERFLPESVSAYAASQIFLSMRGRFPEYTYKEAALNPRNPANRANDWESDLVEHFRNHPGDPELVTTRDTPRGQLLHLARPLKVEDRECLTCHGTVDEAPKPMVAIYGANNGFGWQFGEIVGAQVVSVPMSLPLARARTELNTFLLLLGGVFALLLVLLNVLLHFIVIRPVVRMARIATDVSMGKAGVPEYVLHGGDEIASLSQSFQRMRLSLENAMKMLGE